VEFPSSSTPFTGCNYLPTQPGYTYREGGKERGRRRKEEKTMKEGRKEERVRKGKI
jgi:hypothetical protein